MNSQIDSKDGEIDKFFDSARSDFQGEIRINELLSKHTYYKIGGPARILAIPRSDSDLVWLATACKTLRLPYFVMGAGSNLLVSDQGFAGMVVKTSALPLTIDLRSPHSLNVSAGIPNSTLLRRACSEGWSGLEFLAGVPGTAGGAIAMNAGTHLGESKDAVQQVKVFSMESRGFKNHTTESRDFNYRHCLFLQSGDLMTEVVWKIILKDPAQVKAQVDQTLARRKESQPVEWPSCGSVFKNPVNDAGLKSWQIIDRLGLRGRQAGGAQISEKHPNFIINRGSASCSDVVTLIEIVKSRAEFELGIKMEEEVKYLGAIFR